MAVGGPRLLPALMATIGAVLALKAAALAAEAGSEGAAPAGPTTPATPTKPADPAAASEPAAEPAQCPGASFADQAGLSPSEVQVLQSLSERRKAIEARGADLDAREALLAAAETRIKERVDALKALENQLKTMLGQLDEAEEARVTALVDVYQRMRAKDAAQVFDGLDEDVLLLVASRMRQQNLAEIMGLMDVTRARRLTRLLADQQSAAAEARAAALALAQ